MNKVCKNCRHLIAAGEQHECPSPAYIEFRDRLIQAAAEYDEQFGSEANEPYGTVFSCG